MENDHTISDSYIVVASNDNESFTIVNKIVNYFTVSLFLGGEGRGGGGSKFRFQVMGMIEWGQK